ncbi:MAG: SDR family NAD(P)-dependent oxidoreductase, partial [Phycisphaerales bacterium]
LAQRITDQHGFFDGKPRSVCVPGDASEEGTIDAMLSAAGEHFGRPADLIVANAGRGLSGSVMTSDTGQWEEMVRTNLIGVALLIRKSGQRLLELNAGRDWRAHPADIVVLGSTVGRHISPFSSMYGATKFGVNSLAEAARRELGPSGIRVTLIEPGIVESEFQGVAGYDAESFGQLMDKFSPVLVPEDVARTVGFIVSQPAGVHVCDVVIRPTRQDYP